MSPSERSDLPPEQDAVRRLLAEARHDEPVPPAVAARLDDVLAELASDRREVRAAAPVVDLAARRRRRVGVGVLAAAAVVVAGVGLGQVIGPGGSLDAMSGADAGGDSGASMAESAPPQGEAGDDGAAQDAAPEEGLAGTAPKEALASAPPVELGSLRRDLRLARRLQPDVPEAASSCTLDQAALAGEGTSVPVTLDGRPALALFRVPQGDRQRVDVYLCGTGVPAHTVTLPAR